MEQPRVTTLNKAIMAVTNPMEGCWNRFGLNRKGGERGGLCCLHLWNAEMLTCFIMFHLYFDEWYDSKKKQKGRGDMQKNIRCTKGFGYLTSPTRIFGGRLSNWMIVTFANKKMDDRKIQLIFELIYRSNLPFDPFGELLVLFLANFRLSDASLYSFTSGTPDFLIRSWAWYGHHHMLVMSYELHMYHVI